MEFLIGAVLALSVGVFATFTGLDRDRALYPVVTIIVASYYGLFAVISGSAQVLLNESIGIIVFLIASIVGFRGSLWLIVAALAGHGLFDFVHARVIENPGVPEWWPGFCAAYDIVAAAYLAGLLWSGRVQPGVRGAEKP